MSSQRYTITFTHGLSPANPLEASQWRIASFVSSGASSVGKWPQSGISTKRACGAGRRHSEPVAPTRELILDAPQHQGRTGDIAKPRRQIAAMGERIGLPRHEFGALHVRHADECRCGCKVRSDRGDARSYWPSPPPPARIRPSADAASAQDPPPDRATDRRSRQLLRGPRHVPALSMPSRAPRVRRRTCRG